MSIKLEDVNKVPEWSLYTTGAWYTVTTIAFATAIVHIIQDEQRTFQEGLTLTLFLENYVTIRHIETSMLKRKILYKSFENKHTISLRAARKRCFNLMHILK